MNNLQNFTKKKMNEQNNLIDECFYVNQMRWGTWQSVHKDGRKLISSISEQDCVTATRYYLKMLQEGNHGSGMVYDGIVQGKL